MSNQQLQRQYGDEIYIIKHSTKKYTWTVLIFLLLTLLLTLTR